MRLYVGFITYGKQTAKYLPYFLPSLFNQTYNNFKILAVDNSEDQNNQNAEFIKKNYPELDFKWAGKNLGFAKAYNLMISQAVSQGAEYFLALNPDMILEPEAVERLVAAMNNNRELGSATAKVLKWDFSADKKTDIIDSLGIKLLPGLRFVDAGESKKADQAAREEIIGPSGGSAFYRLSALEKVKQNGQYFDELFFMYKEDCDLAYRLALAGFKSACVDRAVIYHDRSSGGRGESDLAVALNRKNKSRLVRQLSFLNQQIIFFKYWRRQSLINKMAIIWFEFKMLVFIIIFETYLLQEISNLNKIKRHIVRY